MPKNDDEKDDGGKKEDSGKKASDINGQLVADLEFKRRAERLLSRLKSRQGKPPLDEPERPAEKSKDITDKHK